MYEGLVCVICAPVIYTFSIAKRVKDKDFIPDKNGKTNLSTLKTTEKLIAYSDSRRSISRSLAKKYRS